MEDIRLPRYVIDRLEQRWTSRLQQDAKTWSIDRKKPVQARPRPDRRLAGHPRARGH
ncbi:hypothetical protein ABIE86_005409 [Bradyrhizobium diazoefficiens]